MVSTPWIVVADGSRWNYGQLGFAGAWEHLQEVHEALQGVLDTVLSDKELPEQVICRALWDTIENNAADGQDPSFRGTNFHGITYLLQSLRERGNWYQSDGDERWTADSYAPEGYRWQDITLGQLCMVPAVTPVNWMEPWLGRNVGVVLLDAASYEHLSCGPGITDPFEFGQRDPEVRRRALIGGVLFDMQAAQKQRPTLELCLHDPRAGCIISGEGYLQGRYTLHYGSCSIRS